MTMKGQNVLILVALVSVSGCDTLGRMVVNRVGDGLSGSGSTFSSDEDPELVLDAIPFGIKTYESLLVVSPRHRGLLLAAASGFCAYGYLLTQQGQLDGPLDYAARRHLDARVSRLYLRGRDFALRSLALAHPDFAIGFGRDPAHTLAYMRQAEVPFLYWAGIAWAGAISTAKGDAQRISELPAAAALMTRALELDESFDAGAIHEFFVSYEGSRPGGDLDAARAHYQRAYELSGGNRASVHLALAESVSVQQQNADEFRTLIQRALAVDANTVPEWRVVNTIAQRRAAWLDEHITELFINIAEN